MHHMPYGILDMSAGKKFYGRLPPMPHLQGCARRVVDFRVDRRRKHILAEIIIMGLRGRASGTDTSHPIRNPGGIRCLTPGFVPRLLSSVCPQTYLVDYAKAVSDSVTYWSATFWQYYILEMPLRFCYH